MNRPIRLLATLVFAMFLSLMAMATYIQFFQAPSLNADSRNVRSMYRQYKVKRGPIIVNGDDIVSSSPSKDEKDHHKFQRKYKDGSTYAHVTGYMSTVFNSTTGIEKAENGVLAGSSDSLASQRFQELISGEEQRGGGVELTIDPATQKAAVKALNGQRGSVVALDPKTGAILAQVSLPSYDPNKLASHDRESVQKAWNKLAQNKEKPLINRAIAGEQYAPGSTFKMLTATAMLENSGLTPDSTVDAPNSYTPPGTSHSIQNPGERPCGDGSGRVTLREAFIESCNKPFAKGGGAGGAGSGGTAQGKQGTRRSPAGRARGPVAKVPAWRRARSAMFAVPERRLTEGSTPTPSSRHTTSTTGTPWNGSAFPEAGPSPASRRLEPPGRTPSILTSTVTEDALACRATLDRPSRTTATMSSAISVSTAASMASMSSSSSSRPA